MPLPGPSANANNSAKPSMTTKPPHIAHLDHINGPTKVVTSPKNCRHDNLQNGAPKPLSPLLPPKMGLRTGIHAQRVVDEHKQNIVKLKAELEAEKSRNKQLHRDKVAEIKQIRETCEREKHKATQSAIAKVQQEKSNKVKKLRDTLRREKDQEIRDILRYKEEEVRELRAQWTAEKEEAILVALEIQKKSLVDYSGRPHSANPQTHYNNNIRPHSANSMLVIRLQREIKALKDEKRLLAEQLDLKSKADADKAAEIRRLQKQRDTQRNITQNTSRVSSATQREINRTSKQTNADVISDTRRDNSSKRALVKTDSELTEGTASDLNSLGTDVTIEGVNSIPAEVTDRCGDSLGRSNNADSEDSLTTGQGTRTVDLTSVQSESWQAEKAKFEEQLSRSLHSSHEHLSDDVITDHVIALHSSPVEEQKEAEEREKDRQLHKKIGELNTQVNRLEKRVNLLKQENDTLKKSSEERKPQEEKIKKLKKRNAELASIARKLEEKAKQLQQESIKKSREITPRHTQDVEQMKKLFAKQRSREQSEYIKNSLEKDKEIEKLRDKCQELTVTLTTTSTNNTLLNGEVYEDKEELENIIKQAAKERLRLEQQLLQSKVTHSSEIDLNKIKALEDANLALQTEVERLVKGARESEKIEIEVTQRRIECETLNREIDETKRRCVQLEAELQEVLEKNTQLTVQNSDLTQRLQRLEKVNEECQTLRNSLAEVQEESHVQRDHVTKLQTKIDSLETELELMKDISGEKSQLENEHRETQQQLKRKQEELSMLSLAKDEDQRQHEEVITGLQSKLRELERKYELQALKHEELTLEMDHLRWQAERARQRASTQVTRLETDTDDNIIHNGLSPSPRLTNINSGVTGGGVLDNKDIRPEQTKTSERLDDEQELRNLSRQIRALSADSGDEDEKGAQDGEGENQGLPDKVLGIKLARQFQDKDPVILSDTLPKKSPFQVFVAKYCYDPEQFSPNENPEAELYLNAGDYIFVYGTMDEDGFYEGELMDGRRGLIPSNFVEKVPDEDLEEFHASLALREEGSLNESIHHDLEFNSSDESDRVHLDSAAAVISVAKTERDLAHIDEIDETCIPVTESFYDLTEVPGEEVEDGADIPPTPHPRNLQLERQLTNSILISWTSAETFTNQIEAYHVYVDGLFKSAVKSSERTKALVEGVDSSKNHRVCVRSITRDGQSRDPECTMLIGKDISHSPTGLKISKITPTTALVSWLPSNSNYEHVITVNDREYHVTSPGLFQCPLSGLIPGTEIKVTVKSKTSKDIIDAMCATIHFKTVQTDIPDAPLDVQVESGPQEGTLLVTWLPVTITTSGTSNGTQVTGYAVYVDGQRVKHLPSPTGDHVILEAADVAHIPLPRLLSVRTLTADMESIDSQPASLSPQLVQEVGKTGAIVTAHAPSDSLVSTDVIATDETMAIATSDTQEGSELSDIAEEEEELEMADKLTRVPQTKIAPACQSPCQSPRIITGAQDSGPAQNRVPVYSPSSPRKSPSSGQSSSYSAPLQSASRPPGSVPEPDLSTYGDQRSGRSPGGSAGFSTTVDPQRASPRTVDPRSVDGGAALQQENRRPNPADIGFRPIREGNMCDVMQLPARTPPRGAESPARLSPIQIQVPQIEITKDSSGSVSASGTENYSDDDNMSSLSGGHVSSQQPSPSSPDGQGYHDYQQQSNARSDRQVYSPTGTRIARAHSAEGGSQKELQDFTGSVDSQDSFRDDPDRGRHEKRDKKRDGHERGRPNSHGRQDSNGRQDGHERLSQDSHDRNRSDNHDRHHSRERGRQDKRSRQDGQKRATHRHRSRSAKRDSRSPESTERRRDYFDKSDVERSVESPRFDDDSYSGLEDNNALTTKHIRDDIPDSDLIDYEDDGGESLVDSMPDLEYDESRVRIFIALFDYDPSIMSPNPDAMEEELPFKEGQLLKIYGDKDLDGFYLGEWHGRRGLVPYNMVSEVQVDDPDIAAQLLRESNRAGSRSGSRGPSRTSSRGPSSRGPSSRGPSRGPTSRTGSRNDHSRSSSSTRRERSADRHRRRDSSPNGGPPMPPEGPIRKMISVFDYDPHELSPNVDAELELYFKTGELITIFGDMDDDGFYYGELNGRRGLVPSNFLQVAPPMYEQAEKRKSLPNTQRHGPRETNTAPRHTHSQRESTVKPAPHAAPHAAPPAPQSPAKVEKTEQVRKADRPKAASSAGRNHRS